MDVQKTYRVVWEIDIDDTSPEAAAERAMMIMQDGDSTATVFTVTEDNGDVHHIDLGDVA